VLAGWEVADWEARGVSAKAGDCFLSGEEDKFPARVKKEKHQCCERQHCKLTRYHSILSLKTENTVILEIYKLREGHSWVWMW
jgi:hypothetical protein